MGEIVNLNKFRKQKARAAAKEAAEVNRVLHGRSNAEKSLDSARRDKETRDLDAKKRDDSED